MLSIVLTEYLTQVYIRYREQELVDMYLKAEQQIVVFKTPLDTAEMEKNLTKLKAENLQLRLDLDKIMNILLNETQPRIDEFGEIAGERFIINKEENTIQKVIFSKKERRFVPIEKK